MIFYIIQQNLYIYIYIFRHSCLNTPPQNVRFLVWKGSRIPLSSRFSWLFRRLSFLPSSLFFFSFAFPLIAGVRWRSTFSSNTEFCESFRCFPVSIYISKKQFRPSNAQNDHFHSILNKIQILSWFGLWPKDLIKDPEILDSRIPGLRIPGS